MWVFYLLNHHKHHCRNKVHHDHDHHCNVHLGNWEAVESHPTSQGRLWRDRCSQRGNFFSPVCQNIIRIRCKSLRSCWPPEISLFQPCVRAILNYRTTMMLCWTSWCCCFRMVDISNLLLISKSCFDIIANFFHQISDYFKTSNLSVGFSCSSLPARSTQTTSSPPPCQWSA